MIALEPNGNNLLRKAIEFTPSYRDAGDESFRKKELTAIFTTAGWQVETWQRLNIFTDFTPGFVYRWLKPIELHIEANRFLNALCTADLYGLTRA
jgi:hypothetical protein